MKNIVLRIGIVFLNIIYAVIKVLPISDKVTFISRQSNEVPMDFSMLVNEISRTYPQIKTVVLAKKLTMSVSGLLCYIFYIVRQMYHLATSKVVVIDGYCVPVSVLRHKKNIIVIQIWHALGAIKKFGYQTINKPSGHSSDIAKMMRMHRNYDYVTAISDTTAKHFSEAFDVPIDKIIKEGLPRVDYLLDCDNDRSDDICEYYGFDGSKENILYVPTFRKGKEIPLEELIDAIDVERFNLIIKLHPLDDMTIEEKDKGGVIFDSMFSAYDMAKYCDRIITDYSALGIEASLLDKPLYFFIYDIDDYSEDPGMNIDLEDEMGKYAVRTVSELLTVISEEYEYDALNAFKNKYTGNEKENHTESLSRFIASLIKDNEGR